MAILLLTLLFFFQFAFLLKMFRYLYLSPVYLYIVFAVVSISSSTLYYYFYEDKYSLYNLDNVPQSEFLNAISWYLIALNSFVFGCMNYHYFSLRTGRDLFKLSLNDNLFISYGVSKKLIYYVGGFLILIILLFIIAYGKEIFYREDYLSENTIGGLVILIKLLSFIEVILLGVTYKTHKLLSILFFTILFVFSIGTGSRAVIIFLLIFFVLIFLSNGNNLKNKLSFLFNLFLTFLFLGVLMDFRSLESHGIIPYVASLFEEDSGTRDSFFNFYYSFIFGVFATIDTLKKATPDWEVVFISLNPMPGSMAGWYNLAKDMRLNIYAPFTLHGRVFVTGYFFTFVYFFFTGVIFSFFDKTIRNYLKDKKRGLPFILTILTLLHIIYAFEYNMRSAVRYIYYALFILFVIYVVKRLYKALLKTPTDA